MESRRCGREPLGEVVSGLVAYTTFSERDDSIARKIDEGRVRVDVRATFPAVHNCL